MAACRDSVDADDGLIEKSSSTPDDDDSGAPCRRCYMMHCETDMDKIKFKYCCATEIPNICVSASPLQVQKLQLEP